MRSLRRIIVALLILTSPMSALAYVGVDKHCMMTANGMVVEMMDMDMDGDCCDQMKHSGSPEKSSTCNPNLNCNTLQTYPPATIVTLSPVLAPPSLVLTPLTDHNPSPPRDALWRPPRFAS